MNTETLMARMGNHEPPTPQDIMDEARDCPAIGHAIHSWERGKMTWEQAMMTAVVWLAHHNRAIIKQTVEQNWRTAPPPIVVKVVHASHTPFRAVCGADGRDLEMMHVIGATKTQLREKVTCPKCFEIVMQNC